ncbi:DUF4234 domain-containing protein [Pseudomonas moorei]|jgi:hypothetical protein|uniref:DUF4234 domain-containing protein n=1 Tax=Pseudomonas moorei TaxID=395599 RepID=UPI000D470A45|nr:DUF4234 domain-containing protein [Pseudomonas moorei]PPA04965.1 hypothetical protein C4E44_06290 [Pseudomonas sp. MWU12-2312b]
MSDISTLKEKINTKTFHLFLLSLVTWGLYSYIWLYKTSTAIEEVTRIKVMSTSFLVGYLTFISMGAFLVPLVAPFAHWLTVFWSVAIWLITVNWCFRVRTALRTYALTEHNFAPRINRIFSVLFTFYHVNYCINALASDKQKHEDKKRAKQQAIQA